MTVNPQTARKEMLALFANPWTTAANAIIGYNPEIRYQGLEKPGLPGADKYWGRLSTQESDTMHKGHRLADPGVSDVVYDTLGVITFQLFAPMNSPTSWEKGELLNQAARRIFMASSTASGVWFRRPRVRALDNDGTWYRWNVSADYQFSQVKGD